MERSRITPRLRPRPYDLRRKVLLKNFFREQMTYIPTIRSTDETPLDANNDTDFDESESNSNTNEGNILTPKKVEDNIVTPVAVPEPTPSTSNCSEKENSNSIDIAPSDETSSNVSEIEERSSKFPRLSRIIETIDSRLSSKKNRRKGITKAKHDLRSSKGVLKPAGRKIIKDAESSTKVKAKSFFERFKSRREKKRNKSTTSRISNLFGTKNHSVTKCDSKVATTSTQSVQTDMSWSPDHYEKMEQSHRSLLEENRLLSESLSSIITNTDLRSTSTQSSCITDSYANNSDNSTTYFSTQQRAGTKNVGKESYCQPIDSSRTRILRSKSLQNKRSVASSRLRTRSFNSRNIKRPFNADSFVSNDSHYYEQQPYKVKGNTFPSPVASRANTRPSFIKSIDPVPLYKANTSLLQPFSGKSGKAIIRRSSMPERTYHWNNKPRPVRSCSMRENNRYSYTTERVSPYPNQPYPRLRSSTFTGYSCSVPFQDLPVEAFY